MKTHHIEYRRAYLKILDSGPDSKNENDLSLARDLIEGGYAEGKYQTSRARSDHGKVLNLLGFQPNIKGRIFSDELRVAIAKEGWRHKIKTATVWLFGAASANAVNLLTEALKPGILKLISAWQ
jgi:hypothetical protein